MWYPSSVPLSTAPPLAARLPHSLDRIYRESCTLRLTVSLAIDTRCLSAARKRSLHGDCPLPVRVYVSDHPPYPRSRGLPSLAHVSDLWWRSRVIGRRMQPAPIALLVHGRAARE